MMQKLLSAVLLLGVAMAGLLAVPLRAPAQERVQRSTADVRERPPDELDRPRYRERWTHRGYEIRTNQFFVVANTRVEDARWAAEQVESAWADFGRLADAWMSTHHHSEFGIGSVQVYIDSNPPKDRDLPMTTLNVVGIQTQITLHVMPGQPSLEEQRYRLRKAAGQAFLHTAELDRQLPTWACDGLASFVAAQGLTGEQTKIGKEQEDAPGAPRLGGNQWRFKRDQQDRLQSPAMDRDATAEEVKFLLTADDAEHAPAFIAAIGETMAAVQQRRGAENMVTARRGEEQPAQLGPVDHLALHLDKNFQAWRKNPLRGQPVLELEPSSPPEVQQGEREMAVVLKLARRFASGNADKRTVHTRITAFDRERGMTVLSRPAEIRPVPLPELFQRMVAPDKPLWGTLSSRGELVLSTNRTALREILGLDDNRYHWETEEGRSMLMTEVGGRWRLRGWLEENREDPSRPLAKFSVTKLATRG